MPSPFPGMDPYLERRWDDVHLSLCTYARDQLQPQIRPKLVARIDAPGITNPAAVTRPQQRSVLLLDPRRDLSPVTAIEFLTPAVKTAGPARDAYRAEQEARVDDGVSVVEVDLLRAGEWTLHCPRSRIPDASRRPYRVSVYRGWYGSRYEYYHLAPRDPLPRIRIPLRQGDPDAVLDLQALVVQAYANGGYDGTDYAVPADPPLDGEDAKWAADLLVKAGRRKA